MPTIIYQQLAEPVLGDSAGVTADRWLRALELPLPPRVLAVSLLFTSAIPLLSMLPPPVSYPIIGEICLTGIVTSESALLGPIYEQISLTGTISTLVSLLGVLPKC